MQKQIIMMKSIKSSLFVRIVLSVALFVFGISPAMAQEHAVRGVVSDDLGEPLTGAIVRVKGVDNKLSSCDIDGRYSLTGIKRNDVLVVTYVGFSPQEIPVNGRSVIDVKMKEVWGTERSV